MVRRSQTVELAMLEPHSQMHKLQITLHYKVNQSIYRYHNGVEILMGIEFG